MFRLFIKKFINHLENGCWEKYLINNKPSCDYYIKQERLEDDIKIVCEKLNINYDKYKLVSFKREYRKSKKNVKEYYDKETKDLVYQRFKKEIDYNTKKYTIQGVFIKFQHRSFHFTDSDQYSIKKFQTEIKNMYFFIFFFFKYFF